MNNVLLIDDDEDFKNTFQVKIQSESFTLFHKKSFEGLKEIMPKVHHKISAVILDIKCLIDDDQAIEDEKFIGVATKFLDLNYPRFPRIILTGDDDAFEGYKKYTDGENVFQKSPEGLNGVLEQLKYYSENSQILKIKRENLKVFELFEKEYYDANTERTLVSVLEKIGEENFQNFGGILRDVRALQETIYKVINGKRKSVIPDNKFQSNGMIKFNPLMKHLNGNPNAQFVPTTDVFQNSAIFNLANGLYWTSGKYIHADPNESYEISNYTLKSLINALMELFIWSEQYVK